MNGVYIFLMTVFHENKKMYRQGVIGFDICIEQLEKIHRQQQQTLLQLFITR